MQPLPVCWLFWVHLTDPTGFKQTMFDSAQGMTTGLDDMTHTSAISKGGRVTLHKRRQDTAQPNPGRHINTSLNSTAERKAF